MSDEERLLAETEQLSYRLVDVRADLRFARQQLERRKRVVAGTAKLTRATAREREQELDLIVHADAEVADWEDKILRLARTEDKTKAQYEARIRDVNQEQWLIRMAMADAETNLSLAMVQSPLVGLSRELAKLLADQLFFTGESRYQQEREIR